MEILHNLAVLNIKRKENAGWQGAGFALSAWVFE